MRHDYTAIAKDRVSTGVIAVVMGVKDEHRSRTTELLDNRLDLCRQWGELIVDDQGAILTNG